jgi:hypothetical protein
MTDHDEVADDDNAEPRRVPLNSTLGEALAKRLQPHLDKLFTPAATAAIGKVQQGLFDFSKKMEPYLVNLSKIKIEIPEGLKDAFVGLLAALPPNWPVGLDPKLLDPIFSIIQDEGIPLVYVPRADIVTALVDAADREERIRILLDRSDEVIEDCRQVLTTITEPTLTNQTPMAVKALDAIAAGHVEAAQALAVVIVETVVTRTIDKNYGKVRQFVKVDDPGDLGIIELRVNAALAAIGPFYVGWYPNSGTPAPVELSRHVTVHQADASHFNPGNGIVAVVLMTSVLRAIQEMLATP